MRVWVQVILRARGDVEECVQHGAALITLITDNNKLFVYVWHARDSMRLTILTIQNTILVVKVYYIMSINFRVWCSEQCSDFWEVMFGLRNHWTQMSNSVF